MIAVLKGDIIASRKLIHQESWLNPLQDLLREWGESPKDWEIVWGDFFQLEIDSPEEALHKALQIKALIKKTQPPEENRQSSIIDVRMAIGIGEKTYSGSRISESNGPAFIYAGEKFDVLKKQKSTLSVKSKWGDFDQEINLYLKLAGIFMDNWTITSAELMEIVLKNPELTQTEIGEKLAIKQSAVSGRWSRTHVEEVLQIEKIFRNKLKKLRS